MTLRWSNYVSCPSKSAATSDTGWTYFGVHPIHVYAVKQRTGAYE